MTSHLMRGEPDEKNKGCRGGRFTTAHNRLMDDNRGLMDHDVIVTSSPGVVFFFFFFYYVNKFKNFFFFF